MEIREVKGEALKDSGGHQKSVRVILESSGEPHAVRGEKEDRHKNRLIGTWGELVSVPITVILDEEEDQFQLRAIFDGDPDWSKYSTACFWVGVHDAPNNNGIENGQWFPTGDLGMEYHAELDLERWKAGNSAMVHIRKERELGGKREIRFSLHIRPYFVDDSKDFNLMLKFDTWKGANRKKGHDDIILKFQLDKTAAQEKGAMKYEFLKDHGAFNTLGAGNTVHPKQLFTSHAVLQILNENDNLVDKKTINICYIGPDSTENLRSLGRVLGAQTNKKFNTVVACFDEWDQSTAIGPFGGEFSLDDSPLNIKMESIDSLIQPKKKLPNMDFVIATYVTPWSLTGREGDREKYRRLLKKTISKNTIFLTVEPKETTSCVIEIAPEISGHQAVEYYEDVLKLQGTPIVWRDTVGLEKSNQCEATKWTLQRRGSNNGGATS